MPKIKCWLAYTCALLAVPAVALVWAVGMLIVRHLWRVTAHTD
jgi:hypothetical protein